jgi:hypothetical protein
MKKNKNILDMEYKKKRLIKSCNLNLKIPIAIKKNTIVGEIDQKFIILRLFDLCGHLLFIEQEDFIQQWKDALLLLEHNKISCFIKSFWTHYKTKKINEIIFENLYLKNQFIMTQREEYRLKRFLKNKEELKQKYFDNDGWKKLVKKDMITTIRDCEYFFCIEKYTDKPKYYYSDKIISEEKEMLIACNKKISNIKLGIFDHQRKSAVKAYDSFIFLDDQIFRIFPIDGIWSPQQYIEQWNHALERLIYHDTTCFVIDVQINREDDTFFGVSILSVYKIHPYIIVTQFRLYQETFLIHRPTKNAKKLDKILGKFREVKLDDFYKLIPPLKLTKKSEYLVIDNLIEA